MRDRKRLILTASIVVVLAAIGAAGWKAWSKQRSTVEYGGSCGYLRHCRVDGLGLTRWCEAPEASGSFSKPFAPLAACGDDWVVMPDQHGRPGCLEGGGPRCVQVPGIVVEALFVLKQRIAADPTRPGRHLARLVFFGWGDAKRPYRAGTCGAYDSDFLADPPVIVVAGNLDADPDPDCWGLLEDGTVRHLQRD